MQSTQEPEPPTSATRQVWAVPELVGMILSHLEPRDIMVCKRIDRFTRDVINRNTDTDVGRKIWTLPTGTHRKVWLLAQARRGSPGAIRQISETGEEAMKQGNRRERACKPVIANPMLVETTADRDMADVREGYIQRAQLGIGPPRRPDADVVLEWLWGVRPNKPNRAVRMKPRSTTTIQDPLWLEGKSSTANMQLFDPPIYGRVKTTTSKTLKDTITVEVIPLSGSDTSITWGAVGRAYKRVVDRYTKTQLKQHGIVYNHAETKTPIGMEIRLPRFYTIVPQDLYWWFQILLEHYHRFDTQSFANTMGSANDTYEIANAGYNVPSGIPLPFKKYMELAKAEEEHVSVGDAD